METKPGEAEALPVVTIHGVEQQPALFSPLGTVYMTLADLSALLAALSPEQLALVHGRDPQRGTWGTGDMFSRALAAGIPVRGVPSRKR